MKKRVVITGLGVVSPIGIGIKEVTTALMEGKSGANTLTKFDTNGFTTRFACEVKNFVAENYFDKKKARRMDMFVQFAVAAAKMAVEDSKLDISKENPDRIGVIIGSGIGGLSTI